jgi:hypothetical protein
MSTLGPWLILRTFIGVGSSPPFPDVRTQFHKDAKVAELREALKGGLHPAKPEKPEELRMICAGALLVDDRLITSAVKYDNTDPDREFIIVLIFSGAALRRVAEFSKEAASVSTSDSTLSETKQTHFSLNKQSDIGILDSTYGSEATLLPMAPPMTSENIKPSGKSKSIGPNTNSYTNSNTSPKSSPLLSSRLLKSSPLQSSSSSSSSSSIPKQSFLSTSPSSIPMSQALPDLPVLAATDSAHLPLSSSSTTTTRSNVNEFYSNNNLSSRKLTMDQDSSASMELNPVLTALMEESQRQMKLIQQHMQELDFQKSVTLNLAARQLQHHHAVISAAGASAGSVGSQTPRSVSFDGFELGGESVFFDRNTTRYRESADERVSTMQTTVCSFVHCKRVLPEIHPVCSNCGTVQYCGRDCQVSDWQSHQTFCLKHQATIGSLLTSMTSLSKREYKEEEEEEETDEEDEDDYEEEEEDFNDNDTEIETERDVTDLRTSPLRRRSRRQAEVVNNVPNDDETPVLPRQEEVIPEIPPPAAAPPDNPIQIQQPVGWRKYIDIGFLIRLIILAAVFSQNASKERIAAIAACVAIVYLYRVELITDIFYFIRKRVRGCIRSRRTPQLQPADQAAPRQQADVGFGRNAGLPQLAVNEGEDDDDDIQHGLRHPRRNWWLSILEYGRGWIIWDLVSVSSGFILSLLPGFLPDELQEMRLE